MTMTESEKVHFLTEGIYRNLLDNFNPGIRHLISTGRAFQKALHNVATTGKVYIDCIYALAQTGQVCKGATSEIGHALLQIAEVHKEINTQVIDNIKSFHAELLIPLETKQDGEFKQVSSIHKKYLAGHKFHTGPLDKAQNSLKKHRKKNKNAKYGFDQKDIQISRDVRECQTKLDEYRLQNLRCALLEERKRYTFLLDRINAMVRNYASHHSKAQELLTHRLPEWSSLTNNPHLLPESSEHIIHSFKLKTDDMYNDNNDMAGNMDYADPSHGDVTYGTSNPPSITYGTARMFQQNVDPDYGVARGMSIPKQPKPKLQKVRALYNHQGNNETQLSFAEGDVIALIGEKREGWQYGENTTSNRMGWFPINFTQPLDSGGTPHLGHQRVRSLGNLADLANYAPGPGGDQATPEDQNGNGGDFGPDMSTLHRSHTITERPNSLYATRQALALAQGTNKTYSLYADPTEIRFPKGEVTPYMTYDDRAYTTDGLDYTGVPRSQTVPLGMMNPINHSQYPGSIPDVSMLLPRRDSQYDDGSSPAAPPPGGPPPAPPPPPPPPPLPSQNNTIPPAPTPPHPAHQRSHPGTPQHRLPHMTSSPALLAAPGGRAFIQDTPLPPPPPPTLHAESPYGHSSGPPAPSPPQSSSGYSGSGSNSNRANHSSYSGSGSHYSIYGGAGGSVQPQQAPPFPPPPPAPPAPPPLPATSDYEDEPPRNNPFANAKLRKAVTNDRSKPRVF